MRSRTTNRSGVVLRRRTTPAGDVILTLLTPQGKVKAVARGGVRGPMMSRLNLFQHVAAQLYSTPRSDLASVQQVMLEGALPRLAEPERYAYAHLMAELADALFQEGETSGQAFELFSGALRGVSHHEDPEYVALVMSYKMLGLAGFALRTQSCPRCGAEGPDRLDSLTGQLACGRCAASPPLPPGVRDFLGRVQRTTVRALMDGALPTEDRPAAWRALERFVTAQVGEVRSWSALLYSAGGVLTAR